MPPKKSTATDPCKKLRKTECAAPCEWTPGKGNGCGSGSIKVASSPQKVSPPKKSPVKKVSPKTESPKKAVSPMRTSDTYTRRVAELLATVDDLQEENTNITNAAKSLMDENNELKDDIKNLWKKLKDCNDEVPFKEAYPGLYKKRTWGQYFKSFVTK